jgi:tRNA C32,U32 (ribose-2'-O)-methylase TrmJ
MIDSIEKWVGLGLVAFGVLAAWFNTKSDLRQVESRVATLEKDKERTQQNSEDIRELQLKDAAAEEHRKTVTRMLERMDVRAEKTDEKMDRLLQAITTVDTKLQERTKELHSK